MKRIIYLFLLISIWMPSLSARNSTARGLFGGAGTGALFGGLIGGGRGAGWGALTGGLVGTAIGASKDADRKRYYSREDNIDNEDDDRDNAEKESRSTVIKSQKRTPRKKSTTTY